MPYFLQIWEKRINFATSNEYLLVMKKLLSVYGIACLVLLMFGYGLLLVYPKVELHLMLNSYHTDVLDTFFKYYTMLAEWTLYVLALLPLFWKKKELTFFFALCEISGAVVIQILKYIFCSPRPVSVFEQHPGVVLPVVEGIRLHHSYSFPSGHAFTFFNFCTCCALLLAYYYQINGRKNSYRAWALLNLELLLLLALAALGAYSRVFLSQHFLSDVCMGALIGFVTPCLVYYFWGDKFLGTRRNNEIKQNEETIT